MISKLIVFNWKSNPQTLTKSLKLAGLVDYKNIVVCPPFIYLFEIRNKLSNAAVGAQDVFWETGGGPYTGEISPLMLKNIGVKYVIIGHSERRRLGDTDQVINKKVRVAINSGLKVILCIGEPLREGSKKTEKAKEFIKNQLFKDIYEVSFSPRKRRNLIIAYEPVWAISTSKNAKPDNPEDSAEIASFIKETLNFSLGFSPKVLYGGSVTSKNIQHFLRYNEIDGALVGGASLKENELKKIIKIVKK